MTDVENQKNGDAVSTRTPRRSAAGNKAWQALMPHHKQTAAAALEEEEEEEVAPPPPVVARGLSAATARAAAAKAAGGTPAGPAPAMGRKPAILTPAAARAAPAAAAAAPPPSLSASSKGLSDEEELEEASAELFPKPPPDAKKPAKRKGRPPKNGWGAAGSQAGSEERALGNASFMTPGGGKKVKLDDAEDFEMDDEEEMEDEEGDYGLPPMLNRQTSARVPYKRACSPTCTKRCCLTEDGKRVSRQTTTGVRSDQYDPPYNARAGGKRKPRTPKQPSETPSSEKKARVPYGTGKLKIGGMMSGGGGGAGHFVGSSAPGARSMQAVTSGRAVATMPIRMPTTSPAGGNLPARVVTVTPSGKIQSLQSRSALSSTSMPLVARPRVGGSGAAMGSAPKYPVAIAGGSSSSAAASRMMGPQDLLRTENTVENSYREARNAFAKHPVSGSAASEFNRVIDLLTVENKRLIASQNDDQEYVDSLNRKIRALENNVASLQRQLAVTTKAYHGALLEANAERSVAAAAPPAASSRMLMQQPLAAARPAAAAAGAAAGGAAGITQPKQEMKAEEAAEEKPKEENEQHEGEGGGEGGANVSVKAPAAAAAGGAAAQPAAAGRAVPRLMDQSQLQLQQQQGRGNAAAALMMNREQWMHDFGDEEEMYDEMMEEVIEEEEIGFFDDEEEDEDNMGLD